MPLKNQAFEIFSTIKESGIRVPLSIGDTAFYSYWKPSNQTDTPDDDWAATIDDLEEGDISYKIPANILDEAGEWCLRPYVIKDGNRIYSDEGESLTVDELTRCSE